MPIWHFRDSQKFCKESMCHLEAAQCFLRSGFVLVLLVLENGSSLGVAYFDFGIIIVLSCFKFKFLVHGLVGEWRMLCLQMDEMILPLVAFISKRLFY